MSEIIDFENEVLDDEESNMGSVNHSLTVGRITGLLFNDERFEVLPELSLDTSQIDLKRFNLKAKDELVPDICVYTGAPPTPDEKVDDDF